MLRVDFDHVWLISQHTRTGVYEIMAKENLQYITTHSFFQLYHLSSKNTQSSDSSTSRARCNYISQFPNIQRTAGTNSLGVSTILPARGVEGAESNLLEQWRDYNVT